MVADTKMKKGMKFSDIVRGNQSPKSVTGVNPVISAQKKPVTQKKPMTQKKQVLCFTLALWKLFLDNCETYHTAFMTWLLENVADADTTLVGNSNDRFA